MNDILFQRKAYFMVDGKKESSINLKDYFFKHGDGKIILHAEYSEELSSGCKKPKELN